MLTLLFYIGDVKYTIKCDRVREIAPLVKLKQIPHSPDFFAGYFNYRGLIVPVIDLCQLIEGRPSKKRLSTRIILVDYLRKNNTPYILGLIAERVTETSLKSDQDFTTPGIRSTKVPFLGGIVMEQKQMIQYIDLDKIPSVIDLLPVTENDIKNDT